MMDLIHTFLNLTAPPFTFFFLLFFLPPFQIFKFFLSILGTLFSEDVAGKVVVITGASSGIGESLAYEYAKRGACLVLAARRERSLQEVAERARDLGSPDVVVVRADVSKVEDCRKVVDQTMNRFGRLDHLVNNAGITSISMLEEVEDITRYRDIMDINFWGLAYATYFAAPYLRMTRGRIVVIASSASWLNAPRLSFYNASKAAVVSFFETLRTEFGSDIQITLVTPGLVESEMTKGKFLDKEGKMVVDQDLRDVVSAIPVELVGRCAKAIVDGACRGDKYLTVPPWFRTTFFIKMMLPEATDWFNRWFCITEPGIPATEAISKKVVDLPGLKDILWPDSIRSPKIKTN
ncbi:UNVERIFIED_CONTAM: 11-beta-hydroxysteroid dehydrogenase 1A [Sesamum calycinum]|uniref:11-beta-hydroxysteroid dehydrogenase 1A n=1 Tax=Sesamum calycinum TaxID=2727403 RepID=A0AAW2NFN8_9LAMI